MAIAALKMVEFDQFKAEPLTLEELQQMDGEPVWDNFLMEYCVVMMDLCGGKGAVKYFDGGFNRLSEKRFYRRKPEEVRRMVDCQKKCIANVYGRCAVDSCSGAITALDIKWPLRPETAEMLYNSARKMFEDWKEKPDEQV